MLRRRRGKKREAGGEEKVKGRNERLKGRGLRNRQRLGLEFSVRDPNHFITCFLFLFFFSGVANIIFYVY